MLLVVMLVSGVLMGMSGTEDTGLKLSVKKVSKADEGREIYTGQESVSLVLAWNEHAEGTAASDVQWIMCRGRDHLGYQKEEKRQTEGRGTMTYVPDLSVFADGEVTFSFWAVDQAGNTGEEAQIVLMKDSTCPVITGRLDTKGRRVGDFIRTAVRYPFLCRMRTSIFHIGRVCRQRMRMAIHFRGGAEMVTRQRV